jgi:hypothetical protein
MRSQLWFALQYNANCRGQHAHRNACWASLVVRSLLLLLLLSAAVCCVLPQVRISYNGIQDLTMEFPPTQFAGHLKEAGYNAIFFR